VTFLLPAAYAAFVPFQRSVADRYVPVERNTIWLTTGWLFDG